MENLPQLDLPNRGRPRKHRNIGGVLFTPEQYGLIVEYANLTGNNSLASVMRMTALRTIMAELPMLRTVSITPGSIAHAANGSAV